MLFTSCYMCNLPPSVICACSHKTDFSWFLVKIVLSPSKVACLKASLKYYARCSQVSRCYHSRLALVPSFRTEELQSLPPNTLSSVSLYLLFVTLHWVSFLPVLCVVDKCVFLCLECKHCASKNLIMIAVSPVPTFRTSTMLTAE